MLEADLPPLELELSLFPEFMVKIYDRLNYFFFLEIFLLLLRNARNAID